MEIKSNFIYIKSFLLSKIFLVLILFVMFSLYKTLYSGNPSFDGFTINMIIYYIVIAESIELSKVYIFRKISEEIKDGTCIYNLLRPISYISYHYFTSLGEIVLKFISIIIVGFITATIMVGFNKEIIKNFLISLPAIFMGINLNFFIMVMIGMLAFSMEEVSPIYWIYQKFLFILGGLFFPLEFFPQWVQNISKYLPTTYILYFPAKLVVNFNKKLYLQGISIQFFYLILTIIITILIYKKGIKNMSINGG